MDGVALLDALVPQLAAVVDGINPEQLDADTPCANFTVQGVLEHMIAGATAFAPAFRGTAASASVPGRMGTVIERWHHAIQELGAAVHAPGAQERTIESPFGEVTGETFARYLAFDGIVHGWDLAVSTGQSFALDASLIAEIDSFARGLLKPEMRDGDNFAAETVAPSGAGPLEALVAFSGRTVARSPS